MRLGTDPADAERGQARRSFQRVVGVADGAGTMFAAMGALGLAPTEAAAAAPPFRPAPPTSIPAAAESA